MELSDFPRTPRSRWQGWEEGQRVLGGIPLVLLTCFCSLLGFGARYHFGNRIRLLKKIFVPTARGLGLSVEGFMRKEAGSGEIKEDGMKGETVGKGNWL